MSKNQTPEPTPSRADRVVRQEKNSAYNPVVSTEEVALELEISVEEAYELLDDAPRAQSKAISDTHVWW